MCLDQQGMDISVIVPGRLAVGSGIWTLEAMTELARQGYTHIVDLQAEFDDSELGATVGLEVLWNPTDDDFTAKPPEFFERSARFALAALDQPAACIYVHCAAGIHRGPLTMAAILIALGHRLDEALTLVESRRAGADFPEVYTDSLRLWAENRRFQE